MDGRSDALEGEVSAGPRFVLRGSTRPGSHDVALFGLLLGVLVLFVIVIRTVMVDASVGALVFALGMAVALIGALVYSVRAGKALCIIYRDRVVIDSRPQGSGGQRVDVAFADLRSVACDGTWICLRRKDDRVFKFRGGRLHVEDGFDALVSSLDEANPDCMILHR
jgi:hypothetical protein